MVKDERFSGGLLDGATIADLVASEAEGEPQHARSEPPLDLAEAMADLAQRSEAGEALITAANLEDWLEHLLTVHMREDLSGAMAKQIFGRFINSFSAKITMAYAFDLIDDTTRANLVVIKNIRNVFAHARAKMHFESREIDTLASKFTGGNKGISNRLLFGNKAHGCVEAIKAKAESREFNRVFTDEDGERV
jgi:hypothetical protein